MDLENLDETFVDACIFAIGLLIVMGVVEFFFA